MVLSTTMGEGEHALGALARAIGKAHALDTHGLRRCLVPGRIKPGVSRYQARSAPPAWPGGLQRTRLTDRSRWVAGHRLHSRSRSDFQPLAAWLLALRAGSPYPVLAIAGEQGSAKTVLSKLLRAVIDPSAAPVRALTRGERELSSGPTTATSWPSIISAVCGLAVGCPRFRAVGCSPIRTKFCLQPPDPSFSTDRARLRSRHRYSRPRGEPCNVCFTYSQQKSGAFRFLLTYTKGPA